MLIIVPQTRKNLSFESWMKVVDAYISRACYFTSADLPDCCYSDWFEDGKSAKAAAAKAIKMAKCEE